MGKLIRQQVAVARTAGHRQQVAVARRADTALRGETRWPAVCHGTGPEWTVPSAI